MVKIIDKMKLATDVPLQMEQVVEQFFYL